MLRKVNLGVVLKQHPHRLGLPPAAQQQEVRERRAAPERVPDVHVQLGRSLQDAAELGGGAVGGDDVEEVQRQPPGVRPDVR